MDIPKDKRTIVRIRFERVKRRGVYTYEIVHLLSLSKQIRDLCY